MDMNAFKDKYLIYIVLIIILGLFSLFVLTPLLNMVLLGAIFGYGIRPLSKRLNLKIKHNSISICIAVLLLLIPLILVLIYVLSVIGSFAFSLFNNVGGGSSFDLNQIVPLLVQNLPPQFSNITSSITNTLNGAIKDIATWVVNYIVNLLKSLPNIFVQLTILVFATFYFARDGDRVVRYIYAFVPNEKREFVDNIFESVEDVVKSIFYGHFLTAVIIGVIASVGYGILGYPFAIFLGVLTCLFQIIPVIGPWPIYWALAIFDVFTGNYIRAIIVLLFGFGLSLSDMYIRPALASKYADIHPLILLLGFIAGPLALGLVGFILGPLILGVTFTIIKAFKIEVEKDRQINS